MSGYFEVSQNKNENENSKKVEFDHSLKVIKIFCFKTLFKTPCTFFCIDYSCILSFPNNLKSSICFCSKVSKS